MCCSCCVVLLHDFPLKLCDNLGCLTHIIWFDVLTFDTVKSVFLLVHAYCALSRYLSHVAVNCEVLFVKFWKEY